MDINVKKIKENCFTDCYNISLPLINNTQIIGSLVFCNCVNIKQIIIGKNCLMIGSSAFRCCNSMHTVILNCEKPPKLANKSIIDDCPRFAFFVVNNRKLIINDHLAQPIWFDLKRYF